MIRCAWLALWAGVVLTAEVAVVATQPHDFGPTYPGTVCEHTFVFANPGPSAWTVCKAMTSCSCSVPHDLPPAVAAGSSLSVPIRFNVGPRRDGPAGGEISILITSNGQEGRLVCQFQAHVASLLRLPDNRTRLETMTLAAGDPPQTSSCEVRRGLHPAPWDRLVAEVVSGGELITAAVTPIDEARWRVSWTVAPGTLSGSIPGRLDLSCWQGDQRLPLTERLVLPVRIHGAVQADPDNLVFGAFPVGMSDTRTVRLLDRSGQPVAPTTCVPSDPQRCRAEISRESITITYTAVLPAGPAPGWVDLVTDLGTIRLPYLAAVAQPTPAP